MEENQENKSISSDKVSDEELAELVKALSGTTPLPDEKNNVFTFLNNVAKSEDTTKLGNLKEEELGTPILPLRSDKSLSLWSGDVMENQFLKNFFLKEAEITTSTSLSKDGFLSKLAVLNKKEIADVTKPKKINRGWFGHKKEEE